MPKETTKPSTYDKNNFDDFFQPLENTKPYFKAAFEGFAGSGKTYTSALLAIGLHRKIKSDKPIVLFDTEMSAKFLRPLFEDHGIQAVVKESRSLADLKEAMKRCRDGFSDILIIDSISHVWENFLNAYQKKKNRTFLQFQDWGVIKPTWKNEFSDPFVRDPYHVIMCGRAGYEYDNEIDKETGKREIYKSGVKMKVEGETAYEPDFLVYMERFEQVLGDDKKVWREATVLKDRSTLLDGVNFKNPTFEDFEPVLDRVMSQPVKRVEQAEADAAALIQTEDDKRDWIKRRDIALEKIEAYLTKVWPGHSAENKKQKIDALEHAYRSMSWTEISGMSPDTLEAGIGKLHEFVQLQIEQNKPQAEEKNEKTEK